MKRLILFALLLGNFVPPEIFAQELSAPTLTSPTPRLKKEKGTAKKTKESTEPITTEIYAEKAFFDSAKSIGIFTGRVIVKDPRFNVQSDKLTVYMTKGASDQTPSSDEQTQTQQQGQTLEKAVAEGNVGVVRDQPGEDGGPPQHSVGRGDTAIYTTSDGNVELRGSPRVQNGLNTHVATSPDTVMVMTQDGKLTTTGPSRTEIRQEPKASPSVSPTPKPKA